MSKSSQIETMEFFDLCKFNDDLDELGEDQGDIVLLRRKIFIRKLHFLREAWNSEEMILSISYNGLKSLLNEGKEIAEKIPHEQRGQDLINANILMESISKEVKFL